MKITKWLMALFQEPKPTVWGNNVKVEVDGLLCPETREIRTGNSITLERGLWFPGKLSVVANLRTYGKVTAWYDGIR
jgi:hypothetical protein